MYLNGIGGAAQYYARSIEKVLGVNLMEFGIPEAMWHLRVNNFVAIVTMDAHGNSLHADVEKATGAQLAGLQVEVICISMRFAALLTLALLRPWSRLLSAPERCACSLATASRTSASTPLTSSTFIVTRYPKLPG